MKSNLDDLLKKSLSVDETSIDAPEMERLSDVRRVVESRKWKPVKKQTGLLSMFSIFLFPKSSLYPAGLLSMIVAGYFFYVTVGHSVNCGSGVSFHEESMSPASSNTLASLTPTSSNNSSVQSQTVMPSIFTFASQN